MIQHLAVVGATGVVGREFLDLLAERKLPFARISLLASQHSAGTQLDVCGRNLTVETLSDERLAGVTLAVFSAGASVSRTHAPTVVAGGGVVVDNSSAFRMDDGVPLVIPEINPQDAREHHGIVAVPNCSTIVMLMAVAPIHRVFPIRRIVVSTYQAASGAGRKAVEELQHQTRDILDGKQPVCKAFAHPIAFNLFAHDSTVDPSGYNGEELKMIAETRKILHAPDLAITPTCVRVPILRAHSESINLTFDQPVSPDRIRKILANAPGVRLVDDPEHNHFPMPCEASGTDDVLVGRIRTDLSRSDGSGIELFVCGDQLRKGAALNAIQIAELLLDRATSPSAIKT